MKRELKKYTWDYSSIDHTLCVVDKEQEIFIPLDKIGIKSLMRFSIRVLDRMRIDDLKISRIKNDKLREKVSKLKLQLKNARQKSKLGKNKTKTPEAVSEFGPDQMRITI